MANRDSMIGRMFFIALLTVTLAVTGPAWAQFSLPGTPGVSGGSLLPGGDNRHMTVSGQFTTASPGQPAMLFITAELEPHWYIYSITQAPGGPVRTTIELKPSPNYRLLGDFRSMPAPEAKPEPLFDNLVIEKHYNQVTWFAPIALAAGVNPATLKVEGEVKAQRCDPNTCLPPVKFPFTATLGPGLNIPAAAATQSPQSQEPSVYSPPSAQTPAPHQTPTAPPATANSTAEHDLSATEHAGSELPWRPFTTTSFEKVVDPSFSPETVKKNVNDGQKNKSLGGMILFGLVGGLFLNLMPCVLPVIGLKVISFVQQSGQNRTQALLLNLWYSLGLMSVFLVLATLAVVLNMGWGHLFKYAGFNVAMATIVFVMALSFLGIWEIPIPGFVGSGKTAQLAEKEGFSGAFLKGVLTTILATPCTGPLMGSALAWAVRQPAINTYVVFTSVGLGMASPYLLIGAFPSLIRFLPKPGAWMDTFKQIMGFLLLGTVVYIFTYLQMPYVVPTMGLLVGCWAACWWIARTPYTADASAKARAWLEAVAFVGVVWILMFPGLNVLPGGTGFGGLHSVMASRFEKQVNNRVAAFLSPDLPEGTHTVMVDFTADWCPNCKYLEATVLNTEAVRKKVGQNNVITLQADWSHEAPEVTAMLDILGARQIPTLAIFPANNPNEPIVFQDGYTQQQVLDALDRAGPSQGTL